MQCFLNIQVIPGPISIIFAHLEDLPNEMFTEHPSDSQYLAKFFKLVRLVRFI